MGKIIAKNLPCRDPNCGSSDALQVYDDGKAYCFSCNKTFSGLDINTEQAAFESKQPRIEISELPIKALKSWGVSYEVANFYKVRVSYSSEGAISEHHYPYDSGQSIKTRRLPKEFRWQHKTDSLFGVEHFNPGRRVVICEGEKDVLMLQQANWEKYKKFYPVVGLSSSSMATKSLMKHRDFLRGFQEIVLAFDMDDAGAKATEAAIRILGQDKCKVAKLTENDIGDVYTASGGSAVLDCVFNAASYIPNWIITKEQIWEQLEKYQEQKSVPFPTCLAGLNSKLKGHRGGEITLFVSGTGCFASQTKIRLYDGGFKEAKDVGVGDVLLGADNAPRTVTETTSGYDIMYEVRLRDGSRFICTTDHTLTLLDTEEKNIIDICLEEYLELPTMLRKRFEAIKLNSTKSHPFIVCQLFVDRYYGFTTTGDGRIVLDNGLITHNCGKSTILREDMLHIIETTQDKIGVVSLEEAPAETARKLAGMMLKTNLAEFEISLEALRPGFDAVFGDDRVILMDHQGSMSDTSIIDKLEYMCLCGCKYLYIDHITILVSEGADGLQGNEAQDKIMNDLLRLVKKYPDVWIGLVSHLRKVSNTGGKNFEQGRLPTLDDIRGCLAFDTKVIMADGRDRSVQDIVVGDTLMGDDGTPRRVLQLFSGEQQMYRVTMKTSNDSFICNEDHVLTLSRGNEMVDIKVRDFLKTSDYNQSRSKQHYSGGYELPERDTPIPPYFLGTWLGDNTLMVNTETLDKLHMSGILNNSHIPEVYVFNSEQVRCQLLAGILDTIGRYDPDENIYHFNQKCGNTARSLVRIAKSLGLYATIYKGFVSHNSGVIYEVSISGNLNKIPTQKSIKPSKRTNPLISGISLEKLDVQPYFGFQLDGNGRFLLDNHIITHNSGSIKQVSFDIVAFARDLTADSPEERNEIKMSVLKSRYTGLTGAVNGCKYVYNEGRLIPSTFDITEI